MELWRALTLVVLAVLFFHTLPRRSEALIHQVQNVDQIIHYLNIRNNDKTILSFWDVDETIIVPNTTFIAGVAKPDAFIQHVMRLYPTPVADLMLEWMEYMYYNSSVRLVEPTIPNVIQAVSHMGKAFAMTSRDIADKHTPKMMKELGKRVLHMFGDICKPDFNKVPFNSGVFFVNEGDKGKAIGSYLDHCKLDNDRQLVVHVDNTLSKCQDVELELVNRRVEHHIFHYTAIEHQISDHAMLMQFSMLVRDLLARG